MASYQLGPKKYLGVREVLNPHGDKADQKGADPSKRCDRDLHGMPPLLSVGSHPRETTRRLRRNDRQSRHLLGEYGQDSPSPAVMLGSGSAVALRAIANRAAIPQLTDSRRGTDRRRRVLCARSERLLTTARDARVGRTAALSSDPRDAPAFSKRASGRSERVRTCAGRAATSGVAARATLRSAESSRELTRERLPGPLCGRRPGLPCLGDAAALLAEGFGVGGELAVEVELFAGVYAGVVEF